MDSNVILFVILVLIIQQVSLVFSENITVNISQGVLQGYKRQDRNGENYYAFRSIPYAEPPIDVLRFMPPVPHKGWQGILNAVKDVPICYQGKSFAIGKEDCLYLNVYTKQVSPITENKAVMVYFHGGAYTEGSGREEAYNPDFLMTEDVVIVTANYRVGLLGFLSLGQSNSPVTANAGMKDQTMVLRWVKENIPAFGGDANSVTIFGTSAGASSVHLHMFSPLSAGLFHKVIAQSGSALLPWSIGKPGSGEELRKFLNITTEDPKNLLGILQKTKLSDITKAQGSFVEKLGVNLKLFASPIIEQDINGAFLTEHPKVLLTTGNYSHVPLIMGYNDKEGVFVDITNKVSGEHLDLYALKNLIPYDLSIEENNIPILVKELEDYYFDGKHPVESDDAERLIDIVTDIWFLHGIFTTIEKHADSSDQVYFYRFSVDTALNICKLLHPASKYIGASHSDEITYLFKTLLTPRIQLNSIEDIKLTEMIKLWTNFAKYSNPTPDKSDTILGDLKWSPVSTGDNTNRNYLFIGNEKLHEDIINPDYNRIEFWKNIYSKYGNDL